MAKTFAGVATANARIRASRAADAAFVTAIENDAELKRLVGGPSGKSEESYREFLNATSDLRFLIIESLTTGLPIGLCGLLTGLFSDDCEIRVILTKDYRGQGLGTEIASALKEVAAEVFPNKVLTAKVHPDNTASLTIARRLGLTDEGKITSGPYEGWLHLTAL
jgi:RimJ/RimL family protein N-acetyltransferase